MSTNDPVDISQERGVAILRLNMPERRNAISVEMRERLAVALQEAFLREDCVGVVLTGSGGHFSSGGDIRSVRPEPGQVAATVRKRIGLLQDLVRLISNSPKPVVAAVQGKAFGAGMSLVVACDVVLAEPGAEFCAAFGKVGMVPDAGLLYTLPRRVGGARAQQMLLSARPVDAREALATGLVDRIEAGDALLEAACEAARGFTQVAPLAFATMKSLLCGGCNSLDEAFAAELRLQPLLALTRDNHEARSAFAERRAPVFRGY